jgi:50S ribosomal protein L16 3-hydroxylase
MAIEQLLGSVPTATFIDDYYLKFPFARAGDCAHLLELGDWSVLGAILGRPGVDVLAGREGRPWDGPPPTSADDARALLAAGCTIGIRHAEQHHPALAEVAAGFRTDFTAAVDLHLYVTPAGQSGFGWHYDAEDVFLLQLRGDKEWSLRKNTVNPWPVVEALPADMHYERELMPLMRCTLRAGDWLYLPAGYWHRGQAGEESVSLSVGVLSCTALDVCDFLRRRLPASLRWRQRLPTPGAASSLSSEELVRRYRELFAELGQDLAALLAEEGFVRAFLADKGRR